MNFSEFITKDFDVDVYDDYAEDLAVNFVGPAYKFT